ncbi:glycosyltransferase family 4 protein [Kaistia nematophila]|uniref:Glycosyltransferase family 4 protein n=1 Tax=Kaistia nematophila TaxID=2994654 RepID=A0A9X3IJG1_9HYPH|nr:glycosyltransferase family 4 protein [Kaistia nematophila]
MTVVQDGSRLHYGLPLALAHSGILDTVHTDWFVWPRSAEAVFARLMHRFGGVTGRRLAARRCAGLDDSRVVAAGWPSLWERLRESRAELPEAIFARRSQAITRQVLADGWRNANVLAGFVRNVDPALAEAARRDELAVVLDQMIAPIAVELREEEHQAERWPEWWWPQRRDGADIMRDVEIRSWAAASHITCASDYVSNGLIAEGIDRDRISVIPYPVDAAALRYHDRRARRGPIVVGFVGAVSLRKGAPAFLEIARAFDPEVVSFVMVGPATVDPALIERRRGLVEIVGAVPRAEVRDWLNRFDLFLFPSACEGSAGAVLEAMATGLAVVTTPNSGTPVRDGLEGFVLGCDDIDGMIRRVEELVRDDDLRFRMGQAARRRVESLTVERYGKAWHDLLRRILAKTV